MEFWISNLFILQNALLHCNCREVVFDKKLIYQFKGAFKRSLWRFLFCSCLLWFYQGLFYSKFGLACLDWLIIDDVYFSVKINEWLSDLGPKKERIFKHQVTRSDKILMEWGIVLPPSSWQNIYTITKHKS